MDEIHHDLVVSCGVVGRVEASLAIEDVHAYTAGENVVAAAADQRVIASIPEQVLYITTRDDPVVVTRADHDFNIVKHVTGCIAICLTTHEVEHYAALRIGIIRRVNAQTAKKPVRPISAHQPIIAIATG
ncbi:hypothetical protein OCOJLMKI_3280 [Methylobacterium iners]|uniref:Uncharacterized protein n=1 Tax=Methylobacterium iners TaxID=418707 RepID=A0ABQ4S1L0_9HYPH|nr:hypothetical protein OCOJLMKI_3280 [Methylobacterium iners]